MAWLSSFPIISHFIKRSVRYSIELKEQQEARFGLLGLSILSRLVLYSK
jgi:hypothetical protein